MAYGDPKIDLMTNHTDPHGYALYTRNSTTDYPTATFTFPTGSTTWSTGTTTGYYVVPSEEKRLAKLEATVETLKSLVSDQHRTIGRMAERIEELCDLLDEV